MISTLSQTEIARKSIEIERKIILRQNFGKGDLEFAKKLLNEKIDCAECRDILMRLYLNLASRNKHKQLLMKCENFRSATTTTEAERDILGILCQAKAKLGIPII